MRVTLLTIFAKREKMALCNSQTTSLSIAALKRNLPEHLGFHSRSRARGRQPTPANGAQSPYITLAIERATHGAVTRRDLRPNDWHLIWPELAQQAQSTAPTTPATQEA